MQCAPMLETVTTAETVVHGSCTTRVEKRLEALRLRPVQHNDPQGHLPTRRPASPRAGRQSPSGSVSTVCKLHDQRLVLLVAAIARGDTQAFAAFYDATSAYVYGLALRIVRDQFAAEDVVIEVYLQAQRLAATYEPQRGAPLAWLLTLTRSRAIDRVRADTLRQQREAPLEMADTVSSHLADPEASSTVAELRRAVQEALLTLSPAQREVIEIAYYSGLSHSEIAAKLHQPLGTVKTRLRTGMLLLRDLLRPLREGIAEHPGGDRPYSRPA